jgi:ubiquinone/menaquinone biosynthesis C-methylase UbiE
MSLPLASSGDYKVYAFDISYNQVFEAKRAADESNASCFFFQCDMKNIGLPDNSMDYVFVTYSSLGALTKQEDREQSLSEIRRILKPEGLAFISFWNLLWPGKLGSSWLKWGVIHFLQLLGRNNHGFGNRVCWEFGGCILWHYFTYFEAVRLVKELQFDVVDVVPFSGRLGHDVVLKDTLWNRIFAKGLYFVLAGRS